VLLMWFTLGLGVDVVHCGSTVEERAPTIVFAWGLKQLVVLYQMCDLGTHVDILRTESSKARD
jgi:hypothetical protein